jgi:choline dehydrogenase-like flavoprotein
MLDACIIGSGAGGGALAFALTRAGLRVLVLERGPRYSREDYRHESGGLAPGDFIPSPATDPHTVTTVKTTQAVRHTLGWIATCVGGGTEHMGGYFYRFAPDDFRMHSRFGAYQELADWPYSYEELEPYYTQAERLVGVSGAAGADPFEGPRSEPYPMPPLEAHPVAAKLEKACRNRGLHPFPTPRSINSQPYQGRPACRYCEVCASYGCPVGARGTSQEALISRAEATGRCEVRAGAMVREILVSAAGRATGCVYLDEEGAEHRVSARVVCLCASAVESARLLLLSRSAAFPDGLANGNGLVGRHLQFHAVTQGEAFFDPESEAGRRLAEDSHPFIGRSLMDHYFLPEGISEIAKGGVLRFGRSPQVVAGRGAGGSEMATRMAPTTLYFEIFHDFIPNARTFVDLDPDVVDPWGLPVARIHLDLPAHHRLAGRWLSERAHEIYSDLGATAQRLTDLGGTSSYLVHGTCRAGSDPRASVLDSTCRTHEVPNLYVVDGSFMPTSGGAPPTLTILANGLRTARYLLEELRQG